jgi:CobQ-like glutamine amidotransferase family enzyme
MGKNSEATNEVTEDNIKAVKGFLRAVEQLYKDKSAVENLRLETKVVGLLAELYAVDKLYERYHEDYKLFWLGGGKSYNDIELVNKETGKHYGIQVKSVKEKIMSENACCGKSGCYGYMIRHDSWSNYRERTKEG